MPLVYLVCSHGMRFLLLKSFFVLILSLVIGTVFSFMVTLLFLQICHLSAKSYQTVFENNRDSARERDGNWDKSSFLGQEEGGSCGAGNYYSILLKTDSLTQRESGTGRRR